MRAVGRWLAASVELPQYVQDFRDKRVDGGTLLELMRTDDLRELVCDAVHRCRIASGAPPPRSPSACALCICRSLCVAGARAKRALGTDLVLVGDDAQGPSVWLGWGTTRRRRAQAIYIPVGACAQGSAALQLGLRKEPPRPATQVMREGGCEGGRSRGKS